MIGHVLVAKFDHHLPLYRQAEMLAVLLDPIVTRIKEAALGASKLHTDDTPVPMLDPGNGKTRSGWLWVHAVNAPWRFRQTHRLVRLHG